MLRCICRVLISTTVILKIIASDGESELPNIAHVYIDEYLHQFESVYSGVCSSVLRNLHTFLASFKYGCSRDLGEDPQFVCFQRLSSYIGIVRVVGYLLRVCCRVRDLYTSSLL
jgi:hypothetical protein